MTPDKRKQFRRIGHRLKPVLRIADKGLSDSVLKELERALVDHELIKVQVIASTRDEKLAVMTEACAKTGAEVVQRTGHVALIYRRNPQANRKLSNVSRFSGEEG